VVSEEVVAWEELMVVELEEEEEVFTEMVDGDGMMVQL
jgi:hypothetical protein